MTNGEKHLVHAVAFQSGPHWVAQCLEYDIATQASSLDGLILELERIIAAHFVVAAEEHLAPFDDIPKAPKRFWDMYRAARQSRFMCDPAEQLSPSLLQGMPSLELAWAR